MSTENFQSKQQPRLQFAISKEASGCIKGLAVLLMVLVHYWGGRVFHPLVGKVIGSLGGAVFTVMCIENLFRVKWEGIYSDMFPKSIEYRLL